MTDGIERFFAYARERHAIYLRRQRDPGPWTEDPIFSSYRFTNIFRELDRTTIWLRENVREKLPPEEILLATVVFRWFNRVRTGEAIFSQTLLDLGTSPSRGADGLTAWTAREGLALPDWVSLLRSSVESYCGTGPYVTGAYIIKTPDGYNKLDGVLQCIRWFMEQEHLADGHLYGWRMLTHTLEEMRDAGQPVSLEVVWEWLRKFPYLGDFMAYEIVTDLRHSPLLDRAPDIMTWANPGPGATRGLGRVFHENKDHWNQHRDKRLLVQKMREVLEHSQDAGCWPQWTGDGYSQNCDYDQSFQHEGAWPGWEMREVEHTLCEFDKYERVRLGEGRPRGRFP